MENVSLEQRRLIERLQSRDEKVEIRWNDPRGVAAVIKGNLGDWKGEEPETLLNSWVTIYGPLIGPTDIIDNYEYSGTSESKDGNLRIRAQQKFFDVPVYGATLLLFLNRDRGIYRVQSGFYRDIDDSLKSPIKTVLDVKDTIDRLSKTLEERLEKDSEGLEFAQMVKERKLELPEWIMEQFPLTSTPKLWLYPTKENFRIVYRVTAYQSIEWLDVAGLVKKSVENADIVIDALSSEIIKEGAIFGMAYTDTNGDGLSTLQDSNGNYFVRPLIIVRDNNGVLFLVNRSNTPHIITHDAGGTSAGLEAMFQNNTNISEDPDGHWNQTTTSCSPTDRRDSQQPETDGHFNAERSLQFYNNLGWLGFDNGQWGAHCIIRVAAHIGMDYNAFFWRYIDNNNKHHGYVAFYDGYCTGGVISADFMAGDEGTFAHEYQHAITYFGVKHGTGDPGYLEIDGWHRAIHEGLSDSFAGLRTGIWDMPGIWPNGVVRNTKPFRRIAYPRSNDTLGNSSYCDHYDDRGSANDPYFNSSILSHAAFLAGEGGLHERATRSAIYIPVVGVGRAEIAEIIHDAVTDGKFDGIPSNNNEGNTMIEAANFILDSAVEITGSTRSCTYAMLRRALYAVGLYPYDAAYNRLTYGGEVCMIPQTYKWKFSQPYLDFPPDLYRSPDLFININGIQEYDVKVDRENNLFVRVRNIGDQVVNDIRVRFYYRLYGTSLPPSVTQWTPCEDSAGNDCIVDIPSIPAGQMNFTDVDNPPADQSVSWYIDPALILEGLDHFGVRAEIEFTGVTPPNNDNDCINAVESNIGYEVIDERRCSLLGILTALLLATFLVRIGTMPGGIQPPIDLPIYVLLIAVFIYWRRECIPHECKLLTVAIIGFGLGALILLLIALLGGYTTRLLYVLIISIIMAVAAALQAQRRNCFPLAL
ncbi:MAG: hypothetical protein JSV09_04315 [Thermoplasmata archaeon]|nr:MAG: hypothetical protein JSV09_04315 [Thermoplasmata archaeon]